VLNRSLLEKEGLLAHAFQAFDGDGDGVVTQPDVDAFVAQLAAAVERATSDPQGSAAPRLDDGATGEATEPFLSSGSVQLQLQLPEPAARRSGTVHGPAQMRFADFVAMMLHDGSAHNGEGAMLSRSALSLILRSSTMGNTSTVASAEKRSGGCVVM
jgi:hypothetical protein